MIMFNKRVINKGVYNNMYMYQSNRIVLEHKRNTLILNDMLLIVDIKHIKHHMIKLNKYHKHISLGMFSSLTIVKRYRLKTIQLNVLYNYMLFNGLVK